MLAMLALDEAMPLAGLQLIVSPGKAALFSERRSRWGCGRGRWRRWK